MSDFEDDEESVFVSTFTESSTCGLVLAKPLHSPVSRTSVLGKIMEQIFLETVLRHRENKEVMGDSQHGFTKGKSCLTSLVTFYESVTELTGEILVCKLERHGFDVWTTWWIRNWLYGRIQKVVVSCSVSGWRPVMSVIPQVPVLGPLLVKLFVGDMDSGIECKFADGTKLCGVDDNAGGKGCHPEGYSQAGVLHMGWGNFQTQIWAGQQQIESSPKENFGGGVTEGPAVIAVRDQELLPTASPVSSAKPPITCPGKAESLWNLGKPPPLGSAKTS
ncbi:hypothetical protein BTVI_146941 [Pitangus sulphuratus]|nr:hypothetical protein BTVI_146941 [Pitangus sulphuratus]